MAVDTGLYLLALFSFGFGFLFGRLKRRRK